MRATRPRRGAQEADSAPAKAEAPQGAAAEEKVGVKTEEGSAAKTPVWPKEELLRVFDEMIFSDGYSEEVSLANGRVRVLLRTRTVKEINEIQSQLDASSYNLVATLEQRRSFEMLLRSVDSYNGRDLSKMPVSEREVFMNKLPGPVLGMILRALGNFDLKVAQACEEGERNF